jgi:hypothetical protein
MSYREILEHRNVGIIRFCEVSRPSGLNTDADLKRLGLQGSWDDLKEINQETAQHILTLFLWKDAAYQMEVMPLDEAKKYVRSLPVWNSQVQYFTNGNWISHYDGAAYWMSMTEATFDGGIIALSEHLITCYWFEDED